MISLPFWSIILLSTCATAYNILVVVPWSPRSHMNLFEPLVAELGKRGHQVTYISNRAIKDQGNITQLVVPTNIIGPDGKPVDFFATKNMTIWANIFGWPNSGLPVIEEMMKNQQFQQFLETKQKFDVIVQEAFLSESLMAGLSKKFNTPFIGYGVLMPSYWTDFLIGNVAPTSQIPDPFFGLPYDMTFWERFQNFVLRILAEGYYRTIYMARQDALFKKYFGADQPYVEDVVKNMSVLLINDHVSTTFPRPSPPNMIAVNGLHVKPPKPLPKDIQTFLDGCTEGAILFSLGSNIQASTMPAEKSRMFLNTFAKLKLKVIWKFEADLPDLPDNVKIMKWLPQSDILAHPNIKLFITHGGLLGTTEAVVRGVPIIGFPIFGDQPINMKISVNAGVGLSLDYDTVTEDTLLAAIEEILVNPKYREASQVRSLRFHDRPMQPMDQAIYWIEYVVRHKGAHFLRAAAQDLTWYQNNQLDVIGLIVVVILIVIHILKVVFKTLNLFKKSDGKKKKA